MQELNDRSPFCEQSKGNLHSIQEILDVYWLKDRFSEEYSTTQPLHRISGTCIILVLFLLGTRSILSSFFLLSTFYRTSSNSRFQLPLSLTSSLPISVFVSNSPPPLSISPILLTLRLSFLFLLLTHFTFSVIFYRPFSFTCIFSL